MARADRFSVPDPKVVNTLSYMVDGVINMKMDGDKRLLQVSKMKGASCTRKWAEVTITKEGLHIKGFAK